MTVLRSCTRYLVCFGLKFGALAHDFARGSETPNPTLLVSNYTVFTITSDNCQFQGLNTSLEGYLTLAMGPRR